MKREVKTLTVDDSKAILELMGCMLNESGIEDITKAHNGLQALQHFEAALMSGKPYSLVLLDIVMPMMDGQEALKRMRALEKEAGISEDGRAVIIMATSLHSPRDMVAALIDGDCSDYLVKPFQCEDLQGMLSKYNFMQT
jgi:two-component system, chemotaxis family, chemotaxis protein CheY